MSSLGVTKSGSTDPYDLSDQKDYDIAQYGAAGAAPWSQAWGWGLYASTWWPGLCPWDTAGLSRGSALLQAHHLQKEY